MRVAGEYLLAISGVLSFLCLIPQLSLFFSRDKKNGLVKAGYWSIVGIFATVTVASLILLRALVVYDTSFAYVISEANRDMAPIFRMTAFWSGNQGSLFLWLWMLTAISALLALLKVKDCDELDSHALFIVNIVQLFFLVILMLPANNPFAQATAATMGRGMSPLLLHWAMILHPPALFVGYAGLTVPYAYALATVLLGRGDNQWVKASQKWTIFAWLFLSVGIFLGAAWAYVVLGWGGYWGWDPVENASLLPWLTGAALIHSLNAYRYRKALKRWSLLLAVITFFVVILGTFVTRSGIIKSVHAFGTDPVMMWLFLSFMAVILISGIVVAVVSVVKGDEFSPEHEMTSLFSRDLMYHFNNVLLVLGALIVGVASVIVPLFGIEVKASFYNRIAQPIGIFYLAIMALCPMFAWKKTDAAKFEKLLVLPSVITAVLAVPLFFYWRSLENLVSLPGNTTRVSGGLLARLGINVNLLGYIALLVAAFAIVSIGELLVRWVARVRKNTGRGYLYSIASIIFRSPSRVAAYVTHFGVAIIVIGLVGSAVYTANFAAQVRNKKGARFKAADYSFRLVSLGEKAYPSKEDPTKLGKQVYTAIFDLYGAQGKYLGRVTPRMVFYGYYVNPETGQMEAVSEVDIRYEVFKDVFIILRGLDTGNIATAKHVYMSVFINPLISWVWVGSLLLIFGTCVSFWPRKEI